MPKFKNEIRLQCPQQSNRQTYQIPNTDLDFLYNNILSLFVNRTDAFARRYISRDGKSGYTVACDNFKRANCPKKKNSKHKCGSACVEFNPTPLTVEVIEDHFNDKVCIATYVLNAVDNTVKYSVIDLDNHQGNTDPWNDLSFIEKVCKKEKVPFTVIRSQSGTGLHVYFFFEESIPATKARKVIHHLVSEAEKLSPSGDLTGFDAVFPKQDVLTDDKRYGSMIALPFQGGRVPNGHTLVMDPATGYHHPVKDQFGYLEKVAKVPAQTIEAIYKGLGSGPVSFPKSNNQSFPKGKVTVNEIKVAKDFVIAHKNRILYAFNLKKWFIYSGGVWKLDQSGKIITLIIDYVSDQLALAKQKNDEQMIKNMMAFGCHAKVANIEKLAKHNPKVIISSDEFDADPYLLNLKNGTFNLKKMVLQGQSWKDLCSKQAATEFDPTANCPLWIKVLDRIFAGDPEMIGFWQRVCGYSISGLNIEQKLVYAEGVGSNGKSLVLKIIRILLGGYAAHVGFDVFLRGRAVGSVRDDLARLTGIRFLSAVEAEFGQSLSEAVVKSITGGDPLTVRPLYGEYFTYEPVFKIFLAANNMVPVHGTDHGIWRRLLIVRFDQVISESEADKFLDVKLHKEFPGILNWLIEGFKQYQEIGLNPPVKVLNATQSYRTDMNPIADFLRIGCTLSSGLNATKAELYNGYVKFCEENSEKPVTKRTFGRLLRDQNFTDAKKGGKHVWLGIALKAESDSLPASLQDDVIDDSIPTVIAGTPPPQKPVKEDYTPFNGMVGTPPPQKPADESKATIGPFPWERDGWKDPAPFEN